MEENQDILLEKLDTVASIKEDIKDALLEKGQVVTDQDTFASYADKVLAIQTGIDTSDADAVAGDILLNKTAYVQGAKVTGSMPNNGQLNFVASVSAQTIPAGYTSGGTIAAVDSSIDANIIASNIKTGVTILSVTGTFTADADAVVGNILSGKTAYVNGQKLIGTMNNNGDVTVTPSTNQRILNQGYYNTLTIEAVDSTIDANIKQSNIKAGVQILGVTGTYTSDADARAIDILNGRTAYVNGEKIVGNYIPEEYSSQEKTATASTSAVEVYPDEGYNGLSKVTINAVTSAIDNNIIAANIKEGVTILGTTGTVREVHNQTKNIDENGTYTPDNGYTGFSSVTVDINTMPDFVFVQDNYPATSERGILLKKKSALEWWEKIDKSLTDAYVINNSTWGTIKARILASNLYTEEVRTAFNNAKYLLIFNHGYYNDNDYIGVFCSDTAYCGSGYYDTFQLSNYYYIELSSNGYVNKILYNDMTTSRNNKFMPLIRYNSYSNMDIYADSTGLTKTLSKTPERTVEENPLITIVDGADEYETYINSNGSWEGQYDTSVGNAIASDILNTKTAFVNNTKLTGTMPNNGQLNYTPTTSQQSIPAGYTSGGTISAVTSAIDSNITAANIRAGVTILGVEGNLAPDKPDQSKTVTPTTSQQIVEPDTGYELASVTVNAVTNAIDENIVASNIKDGVTILGVTGTVEEVNGETVNITPSTSAQTITPTQGKNAITQANVAAVTSAIDENIVAGNIKTGVEILGVTGTLDETLTMEEYILALELADDILGGEYPETMDVLNEITGGTPDEYEGLGGTEEEVEAVFDEILGNTDENNDMENVTTEEE